MTRISESGLVLPALYVIRENGGNASTGNLITELNIMLKPTGEDNEILKGRNDTKFSQKVRNLKSHNQLTKPGFAKYGKSKTYEITQKGIEFLDDNIDNLNVLLNFDYFSVTDALSAINTSGNREFLDEKVIVEGRLSSRSQEYRSRSTTLRDAALEHYSVNGVIACHVCGFDFSRAFPDIGRNTIQIHHLIPISYLRGEELNLSDALGSVCPLCANCHVIVHKEDPPISIQRMQSILRVDYSYSE